MVSGTFMSKAGLDNEISDSHLSSCSNAPANSSSVHWVVFHSPRYCWCSFFGGNLLLSMLSRRERTRLLSSSTVKAEFLNNGKISLTVDSTLSFIKFCCCDSQESL